MIYSSYPQVALITQGVEIVIAFVIRHILRIMLMLMEQHELQPRTTPVCPGAASSRTVHIGCGSGVSGAARRRSALLPAAPISRHRAWQAYLFQNGCLRPLATGGSRLVGARTGSRRAVSLRDDVAVLSVVDAAGLLKERVRTSGPCDADEDQRRPQQPQWQGRPDAISSRVSRKVSDEQMKSLRLQRHSSMVNGTT